MNGQSGVTVKLRKTIPMVALKTFVKGQFTRDAGEGGGGCGVRCQVTQSTRTACGARRQQINGRAYRPTLVLYEIE